MTLYKASFDGSAMDNHIRRLQNRECYGAWTITDGEGKTRVSVFPVDANSSNQAEYEALKGLLKELAGQLTVGDELEIAGDSQLVVNQVNGRFVCRNPRLYRRLVEVRDLIGQLPVPCKLYNIDRDHNPAGRLMEKHVKRMRNDGERPSA